MSACFVEIIPEWELRAASRDGEAATSSGAGSVRDQGSLLPASNQAAIRDYSVISDAMDH